MVKLRLNSANDGTWDVVRDDGSEAIVFEGNSHAIALSIMDAVNVEQGGDIDRITCSESGDTLER